MMKILASILLLSIIACGQKSTKGDSDMKVSQLNGDWKTLEGPNYSIQYPSVWESNQSGQMGTSFILFAPVESPQDKFRVNVHLLIQDLTGQNYNLDQYTELSEGQVMTMITNSNLLESKRMKSDSYEYHKMLYTGDRGAFQLKTEQYYFIVNEKAYVLTLTCEQTKFDKYKEVGEKILGTFRLKG